MSKLRKRPLKFLFKKCFWSLPHSPVDAIFFLSSFEEVGGNGASSKIKLAFSNYFLCLFYFFIRQMFFFDFEFNRRTTMNTNDFFLLSSGRTFD